jgi:hypothetical protein
VKTFSGVIGKTGIVEAGKGFTANHPATGQYVVNFPAGTWSASEFLVPTLTPIIPVGSTDPLPSSSAISQMLSNPDGSASFTADFAGRDTVFGFVVAASFFPCTDGVKDGSESDVDCGGNLCDPCANGKQCAIDEDCSSGFCGNGVCMTPTCTDHIKNGNETDVDCGGGTCGPCQVGKVCALNSDCVSGLCQNGVCQSGTLLNGQACASGAQCASGFCADGVCCNTSCSGICMACTAAKKGSGSDGTCGPVQAGTDPDNECALACNGAGACQGCPAGQSLCGTVCADFSTDVNNCGGCGRACPTGDVCINGACTCPAGHTICNGKCINTSTDINNCGACGQACPAGKSCVNGLCS